MLSRFKTLIWTCLFLVGMVSTPCHAQISFGNQQFISSVAGEDIITADLNNDGFQDLISCNYQANTVAWYENHGDGSFSPAMTISSNANQVKAVHAADFDNDGDIDVLSASQGIHKIVWYENVGGGAFLDHIIITAIFNDYIEDVYPADLDNDGDMDVVSASRLNDRIIWYENLGGGSFSNEMIISSDADGARSVHATDLDNDGDMDVLSASQNDDKIAWYENLGDGSFSNELIISTDALTAWSVFAADLDNDGDMDVLSASRDDNKIAWYENLGDGSFSIELIISSNADGARSVFAADFDNDGDMDVLSGSNIDNKIAWYENQGDGSFSDELILPTDAMDASSVYAADLDNDGDIDVLSASSTQSKFAWYENFGDGIFSMDKIITTSVHNLSDIYAADLDNDGDQDVVSAMYDEGKIAWHENLGNGAFSARLIISNSADGANDVYVADLDDDGDLDVLSASEFDDKIAWYENLGDGSFSGELIISTDANGARSVYADDLDNDGDMDVLSASLYDDEIAWYENQGGGTFSDESVISTNAEDPRSVSSADLDNDGDMDVLSASQDDDKIAWYENQGDGTFSEEIIITTNADGALSVFPGDFDNDGDMDVLSASYNDEKIAWYENQGNGTFSAQLIISTDVQYLRNVYPADLDNDGDLDIVACASLSDNIIWLENSGNGAFSVQLANSENSIAATEVFVADLDNDGYLDVLSGSWSKDQLFWFENTFGEGCTNSEACNYNELSFIDDGSCCFDDCGCTNQLANNYNPSAICDDGTCTYTFSGFVYNDEDENGSFDNDDFVLPFQEITVEPLGVTLITDDNGEFAYEYNGPLSLTFSVAFNEQFPFNITPASLTLSPLQDDGLTMEFGMAKEIADFGICIDLYPSGNNFLCNDWSNHNICYRNMGNVPIDGIVELEYDDLFQGHEEVTPIDSVTGNTVYMSFENLQPGQMFFYDVDLLTPTVDHIGEYITSFARVTGFYEGIQVAYGEQELTMEITCAYDPNDKQAFPLGYTDDHLLLQETEQEFLIRFQNTGNAPAQDVRIQDTLDVNFDIESFKLMANSHSVMTTIDPETRLIDFFFEDIQLPDSVNDEPNSHGLISYKITPLPDLPIGTVLENTAYIYFDNNEAIVTNTTWTTIHECGGEAELSTDYFYDCEGITVEIESTYPLIEDYTWEIEGEAIDALSLVNIFPVTSDTYEVTLTATNPLCSEINTIVYDPPNVESPCLVDLNCDGHRNTDDLLLLLSDYGCQELCNHDIDDNDVVNVNDLLMFMTFFSQSCWED